MTEKVAYTVHKIRMGDVDDPDVLVGEPIWNWLQTEAGKWVLENSLEQPMWTRHPDYWGHMYHITAYLTPKQITFFKLKFE